MRLKAKTRKAINSKLFALDNFQADVSAAWDSVVAIVESAGLHVPGMVWVAPTSDLRLQLTEGQDNEFGEIENSFLIFQTYPFPSGRVELNVYLS